MSDYYQILHHSQEDGKHCYHVALNALCDVYAGHFPGHPISPGACNLEMIRQCVSDALGRDVRFEFIRQCRYLNLVVPAECPELDVIFTVEESRLTAFLQKADAVYVSLKADIR